jgi:hypothetical protein
MITHKELAAKYKIHPATLRNWLKKIGITSDCLGRKRIISYNSYQIDKIYQIFGIPK